MTFLSNGSSANDSSTIQSKILDVVVKSCSFVWIYFVQRGNQGSPGPSNRCPDPPEDFMINLT